ncbi:MAG: hypothetical protein ACKO5Q_00325 [Microcystaceae cyanobacterium]
MIEAPLETPIETPIQEPIEAPREITRQERLESVKAGAWAAIAFTGSYGLAVSLHHLFKLPMPETTLFHWGSSLLSGFLFGVTYRYIVRNDPNPHLRDGAVLAFTLVRSGGFLTALSQPLTQGVSLSIGLGESLMGFAIARSCLDLALARHWVKPFR